MKNSIWKSEKGSSVLYTKPKANVGQIHDETVFVEFFPRAVIITGAFKTPDGKSIYQIEINRITQPEPKMGASAAFGRKSVSPRASNVLREIAIKLVTTLPKDLEEYGAEFSRLDLWKALKIVRPIGEGVIETALSRGNRHRR